MREASNPITPPHLCAHDVRQMGIQTSSRMLPFLYLDELCALILPLSCCPKGAVLFLYVLIFPAVT